MAISESDRHELYQTLERVLGKEASDAMMSLLPPVGWADVATKRDLEALEARIGERITRTALMVNIPSIVAAVGLALAAARLG